MNTPQYPLETKILLLLALQVTPSLCSTEKVLLCVQKKETRDSSLKTRALASSRWTKQGFSLNWLRKMRQAANILWSLCFYVKIVFKGTVSRDGYFFWRSKHFNLYFLCMPLWFSMSFKSFSLLYTIINFLIASFWNYLLILKMLTETLLRILFSVVVDFHWPLIGCNENARELTCHQRLLVLFYRITGGFL